MLTLELELTIGASGSQNAVLLAEDVQQQLAGAVHDLGILITTEVDSIGDEEVNGVVMCSPYVSYDKVEDCTNDFVKSCLQKFYDKYGYCPTDDQFYKMWDAMLLIENAVLAAGSVKPKEMQKVISGLTIDATAGTMDFTRGTNECYFTARAWVYSGRGAAGAPMTLEDWLKTHLVEKVVITNQK